MRFSSKDLNEQVSILNTLSSIVKRVKNSVCRHATEDNLLFVPTGDGMIIVFIPHSGNDSREVDRPIRWAWKITQALRTHNASSNRKKIKFQIRIGLHTDRGETVIGPDGRHNIVGPAVNTAQRLMDCGEAGHIIASKPYGDKLIADNNKYQVLSFAPSRLPVKHSFEDVYNVYGMLEGIEAGNSIPPELKPRAEALPLDLRPTISLIGEILRQDKPGISALGLSLFHACRKRLEILHDVKISKEESWNAVWNMLGKYHTDNHTQMELVSIIHPEQWADEKWRLYQGQILTAASRPSSFTRRLHVIESDDFDKNLSKLLPLLLAEFICSIKARVLVITKDELEPISQDPNFEIGYLWHGFTLFDCGTYHLEGGNYDVIFSDIEPYFANSQKRTGPNFNIYQFSNYPDSRYMYEELRANFFRVWHDRDMQIRKLPKIWELCKAKGITCNETEISSFLPDEGLTSLRQNWQEDVCALLGKKLPRTICSDDEERDTLLKLAREDFLVKTLPRLR